MFEKVRNKGLLLPLLNSEEFNKIIYNINENLCPITISGLDYSPKVHVACSICEKTGFKGVFVTYNEMISRKIYEDFSFFFGNDAVLFLAKDIIFHDVEAASLETVHQRICTMNKIMNGDFCFLITSINAISQKLISKELFSKSTINISLDKSIDLEDLIKNLVEIGYKRENIVEGKGQFAVRGGIIDIYPINSENAVRIELFDETIDLIKTFDVFSQRSIGKLDFVKILPAREYIKDSSSTIIDYISSEKILFIDEPSKIKSGMENILFEYYEAYKDALEKGYGRAEKENIYFSLDELFNKFNKNKMIFLNSFPVDNGAYGGRENISIPSKSIVSYQGHFNLFIDDIAKRKKKGQKIVILSGTKAAGERLINNLKDEDIEVVYVDNIGAEVLPGQVIVTHGNFLTGFEYPVLNFVVISDNQLFGKDRKQKKSKSKHKGKKISIFTDLSVGDYVVHEVHGIGQYIGIQTLSVDNIKRDYLKIKYQGSDVLYVPTNQLDIIQKYIGGEARLPKLNKFGGAEWEKTKARVKESLKEVAQELIELYAKRETLKGHAFSADTTWQKQFEEMFPYEETLDQLQCIEEIKKDMESEKPMDRLLCGDVGYGKTEVALRAIFKSVMDGKQVAYLVPTTILAHQHYSNFIERMKDFSVSVEVLSRFRTKPEQKKILKSLKAGTLDVLIGTHRLLQKDIQFKNLGLLVVDEEQRFGVTHKEKLKSIKANVDVLTLTATPIPRTLHMSLVGIRDISTIEEPPEERYPVQTYVMEYNPGVVKDAIVKEISRNGQVFYLYNRVQSILSKANEINRLVPEARIAVAHGQMDEKELEDVIFNFINGEFDIMVCTTIIESGIDMPNVNTIIIEDGDKFGLAQLYQLRGRVGRSNKLAYAYITYRKNKVLSEVAEKRLKAIKEFTEFGSGFKIAMRDLEIRGSGSIIGHKQHGHIEAVGYEMYCQLLEEAVGTLKGEAPKIADTEITIDININAYIDEGYISQEDQRIDMYKRIALIESQEDAIDVQDELIDRYGDIPLSVNNLIEIALIKVFMKKCGMISLQEKKDTIILQFKAFDSSNLQMLSKLSQKYKGKIMFTAVENPYMTYKIKDIERNSLLKNIKLLLQDIQGGF